MKNTKITVAAVIGMLTGIAITLALIPYINAMFNTKPIVKGMNSTQWDVGSSYVMARIVGEKLRGECRVVVGSATGFIRSGTQAWHETSFKFFQDVSPNNSKPVGLYDFGWWRWNSDVITDPTEVMMTIVHDCDGIEKQTTIGPWHIPKTAHSKSQTKQQPKTKK